MLFLYNLRRLPLYISENLIAIRITRTFIYKVSAHSVDQVNKKSINYSKQACKSRGRYQSYYLHPVQCKQYLTSSTVIYVLARTTLQKVQ